MKRYYTNAMPKPELKRLMLRYGKRGSEFDGPGHDMALANAWFGTLPSFAPPPWPLLNLVVVGRVAGFSREWLDRVVGSFELMSHFGRPSCVVWGHAGASSRDDRERDELAVWVDEGVLCADFYSKGSSPELDAAVLVARDVVRAFDVPVEVSVEEGRIGFLSKSEAFKAASRVPGFSWRFEGSSAAEVAARVNAAARSIAVGESLFKWRLSMRDVDKWVQAINTINQLGWPGEVFAFDVSAEDVKDSDFCEYFAQYCENTDEVQTYFRELSDGESSLYVVADATGWRVVLETEDPAVAQRIAKKTGVPWVEERDRVWWRNDPP